MKRIYTLILLSFMLNDFRSQTFNWAKDEGLYSYDYGLGIVNDNAGNVYLTGKYEMNAIFSGNTLTCAGNHDIFLAKYSAGGSLTWIRTGGGLIGDYARTIACDGSSNVVIAGEIEGAPGSLITFPGSTITLTTLGDNDFMFAKYDLNGNLLMAKREGGYGNEKADAVCLDNSANMIFCGHYDQPITWNGTSTINGAGQEDIFIVKYDQNGNFQWVRNIGGPGRDEAKGIRSDAAGNIYVTGWYSNGCVFGTTTYSTVSGAFLDIFLAKYDPNGNLLWVKTYGSPWDDGAWSMTMDNAGLLYICGEFNASIFFGATQVITNGNADAFVVCFDQNGNPIWAKGGGGPVQDRARAIGCDGSNLFLTGQFGISATFGSTNLTAADSSDVFFASLSNSGTFLSASSVGGPADAFEPNGYESGTAICAEASGNVYAAGSLLNGGTFGSISVTSYGKTDAFITKINQMVGMNTITNSRQKSIQVYPNPGTGNFTIDFDEQITAKYELNVINCLGQTVDTKTNKTSSRTTLDLSGLENGVYFIEVKSEDKTIATKKIIVHK